MDHDQPNAPSTGKAPDGELGRILVTEEQIALRVRELGAQISDFSLASSNLWPSTHTLMWRGSSRLWRIGEMSGAVCLHVLFPRLTRWAGRLT